MKQRGSPIILLLILFSSFLLLIRTAPTVQAAPAFSVGDEFLYKVDATDEVNNNETLIVYNDYSQSVNSKYNSFEYSMLLTSFVVTNYTDGNGILANVSTNEYYKGYAIFSWQYGYDGVQWSLNNEENVDLTHGPEFDHAEFYADETYYGVTNTNISADFMGYSGRTGLSYIGSNYWNGTINGNNQTIEVETYSGYYTESTASQEYVFDFYCDVTETNEWAVTYFVDPNTGAVLECQYVYTYTKEGSVTVFSDRFNSTVQFSMKDVTIRTETWKLQETTIGYTPVSDASLPGIYDVIVFEDSIYDNNSHVSYTFIISEPSNSVDGYMYIDSQLIYTWYGLSSGENHLGFLGSVVPYNGPNTYHEIKFVFVDAYNHNTTWVGSLYDDRIKQPEWPCWIEGETNITVYTADQQFYLYYDIYADTNWTLYAYQIVDNQQFMFIKTVGYLNSTIVFGNSTAYPTVYHYYLELFDAGGYIYDLNVTVNVLEGSNIAPDIYGPSDMDYYIGADQIIYYELYDDDPTNYEFYMNGTLTLTDAYYDGMEVSINLMDYIFDEGTYNLTMVAYDNTGHVTKYTSYIYALIDDMPPHIHTDNLEIFMKQGENKYLSVSVYDDNPGYIELYRNNSQIESYNDWLDTYYTIDYSLKDLLNGTWIFEIKAIDAFGNIASITITVHVSPVTQETNTSTTGSNTQETISVDAPSVIISVLSLIGLTNVTIMKLKRKR